ncbi:hypothetical protein MMC17_007549 [Xylographa soralifera]|nr:hypothetical protein [Xylographa soralifera]
MRAGGYVRDLRTRNPGFTPGYDLVGVIEALGKPSLSSTSTHPQHTFRTGDLVASMSVIGAYATHTTLPLDELLPLRPSDDLVQKILTPRSMTAYGLLARSAFPLSASTSSLLIGSVAGGVGTAIAQVVRLLSPHIRLLGTCSPSKFAFARSLGVEPIDRTLPPAQIAASVRALTGGAGVDIAYEATGAEANLAAWLAATKDGVGKVLAIGFLANVRGDGAGMVAAGAAFDPVGFVAERAERMSFFSVTGDYWRGRREVFREDFEGVLLRAVREGRLQPVVGKLWRLEDAVRVNERLASGEGVLGKMEMLVDDELWREFGGETT